MMSCKHHPDYNPVSGAPPRKNTVLRYYNQPEGWYTEVVPCGRCWKAYAKRLEQDKARMDWIEAQSGYTHRWVARQSRDKPSRGFRLHNTSGKPNYLTAREAIDKAKESSNEL